MTAETRPAEIKEVPAAFQAKVAWRGGALAGLIATIAMGVVITAMNIEVLRVAIAGLYGFAGNIAIGWIAHLAHGVLFGIGFAVLLSEPGMYGMGKRVRSSVVAGIGYGLFLAIVAAGIIMPIWLSIVGLTSLPSLPNVTTAMVVWHLIYGSVLGGLFPFLKAL